jgi:hypothetical protein
VTSCGERGKERVLREMFCETTLYIYENSKVKSTKNCKKGRWRREKD